MQELNKKVIITQYSDYWRLRRIEQVHQVNCGGALSQRLAKCSLIGQTEIRNRMAWRLGKPGGRLNFPINVEVVGWRQNRKQREEKLK